MIRDRIVKSLAKLSRLIDRPQTSKDVTTMDENRKQEIAKALNQKGVNRPCPRCGNNRFALVDESYISIQSNLAVMNIGGPVIPTVIVACEQCGYITEHAQAVLGVMKHGGANG